MSKVTVVGAGAVGATCANVMACREVASEVVLIDIKEGLSEGKMLDMYQCSTPMDFDTKLVGVTNDYNGTARRSQAGAPYRIAGKTGTAQVFSVGQNEKYNEKDIAERLRDHALFIAFAPAEAPKLAVAVLPPARTR